MALAQAPWARRREARALPPHVRTGPPQATTSFTRCLNQSWDQDVGKLHNYILKVLKITQIQTCLPGTIVCAQGRMLALPPLWLWPWTGSFALCLGFQGPYHRGDPEARRASRLLESA